MSIIILDPLKTYKLGKFEIKLNVIQGNVSDDILYVEPDVVKGDEQDSAVVYFEPQMDDDNVPFASMRIDNDGDFTQTVYKAFHESGSPLKPKKAITVTQEGHPKVLTDNVKITLV